MYWTFLGLTVLQRGKENEAYGVVDDAVNACRSGRLGGFKQACELASINARTIPTLRPVSFDERNDLLAVAFVYDILLGMT